MDTAEERPTPRTMRVLSAPHAMVSGQKRQAREKDDDVDVDDRPVKRSRSMSCVGDESSMLKPVPSEIVHPNVGPGTGVGGDCGPDASSTSGAADTESESDVSSTTGAQAEIIGPGWAQEHEGHSIHRRPVSTYDTAGSSDLLSSWKLIGNPTSTKGEAPTTDIIYLTGASGFIGQYIVRRCEADESIGKVYCPIRDKKGQSGAERFASLFGDVSTKASFVAPSDPIPEDANLVILNAYAVKFYTPVEQILKDNVVPMLELLEQCRAAGPRIRGISVVSTAYVQPPLPFQRSEKDQIPFQLSTWTTPTKLFKGLVSGSITGKDVIDKYDAELTTHHKINCYALSKHIMETVIHERFPHLPICIVRPAIVAPTRDGSYGHGTRTGFPLFVEIAKSPIMRFPRNEGNLNLVFVEDVAEDIVNGASRWARPAERAESGEYFHPIHTSTTLSELPAISMFKLAAPDVRRFDIRNDKLRLMLRETEIGVVSLLKGKRAARLTRQI